MLLTFPESAQERVPSALWALKIVIGFTLLTDSLKAFLSCHTFESAGMLQTSVFLAYIDKPRYQSETREFFQLGHIPIMFRLMQ